VIVDQAGNYSASVEIDAARAGSGKARHLFGGSSGDEAVALNGDGLGYREAVVYGDDFTVQQDEIGYLRGRSKGG